MFFIIAFATVCFLIYLLHQHNHSYWTRLGFTQLKPKFIVGDSLAVVTLKMSIGEFFEKLYKENKHIQAVGVYFSYQPAVLVTDKMLLQRIMITDFTKFHDRPVPFDLSNEPLANHLFHLSGQKWRDLRVKLSPTFTSGKLKGMFPVIKSCGQTLNDYLEKQVNAGNDEFEFRDLMARFNTNIISSVAFGIDNDCINEPDHIFRQMGAKNFKPNWRTTLTNIIAFLMPKLFNYISFKTIDPEVNEFIVSIVKQTIDLREKNNIERNDFMQLLIQLKNQGYVSADKGEKTENSDEVKKLSFNDLAAQVFVFFIAGYETSSSTMSYCLYELAKNPAVLHNVHEEIDKVFKSAGPDGITYEMLNEMKYLECVIDEALRKYPIVPLLFRLCNEDFTIVESGLVIPKGVGVMIPVLGLQRDPEIYENPMEFRPERFFKSSHGAGDTKGVFYMPFGEGPRNCIGMRLGKLTAKLGLATVLSKYSVEFVDKRMLDSELEFDPRQFILAPVRGFNLRAVPRSSGQF